MAKAKIENYHGYPAIMINGEIYPPMTATITTCTKDKGKKERTLDREYYRRLGSAGIKNILRLCNNCELEEDAIQQFDSESKNNFNRCSRCIHNCEDTTPPDG